MRAPKVRIKTSYSGCTVCNGTCIDEKRIFHRSYVTRSLAKYWKETEVIIYETYRCMPLLGNEKMVAPDWEEHIVSDKQQMLSEPYKCYILQTYAH